MNTKDVDYILEIEKCQSISKAAKALFISQPALSRFLTNLEQGLGTQLFVRDNNEFHTTEAGKIYVEFAKSVQEQREKMLRRIAALKSSRKNVVWIGYTMASNSMMFYRISKEFNLLFPNDEIKFVRIYDRDIESSLDSFSLSFALSTWPVHPDKIEYYNSFDSYMLLVIPKNIDLKTAPVDRPDCPYPWIDIKKLSDDPFNLPDETCRLRKQFDEVLRQLDTTLNNVPITTDNSLTALYYTKQGQGISVSTENVVRHFQLEGKCDLYCIGTPPAMRKNGILYRKGKKFSRQEEACLELLKKHYTFL